MRFLTRRSCAGFPSFSKRTGWAHFSEEFISSIKTSTKPGEWFRVGHRVKVDSFSISTVLWLPAIDAAPDALLAMDEAMAKLALEAPEKVELVKLRHFAGCSLAEAASSMGVSHATAKRYWTYARAWLYTELIGKGP